MKTLRDEKCRAALIQRINALTPDSKPVWGSMNVEQMLSHLVQSNEMPFVSSVPDVSNWMSRNVLRPLVVNVLPVPKNVKTGPELNQQEKGRVPVGFEADRASAAESINKLGTIAEDHRCLDHPFFGPMSAKEWGLMAHKHMDHHLKQFGV
ncbi:MAG TPA: DUF1569 domain-containing protein [Pyrinomonadaceae bacterium]|nr:DUF1569 domain-containing protein [Pyrinomonadaceae bacterium]